MMLWPPMVPVVWPMPSAVVAIANAGIDSMNTREKAPTAATTKPSTSRIAGWCFSVHRPKLTANSIGGMAKHAAVRPRVVPSAPSASSR